LDVSCIILAGGQSTRLGRNKVVERIGNQSLLERVVSSLSTFRKDIIIVEAKNSSLPRLEGYPKLKIVQDIHPDRGSLGGIYSGLVSSQSFHNLVVACDMPFLNLGLLRYMMDIADGYDVIVPKVSQEIFEPLHAIYSLNCAASLELLIRENKFKILELFPLVKVRYLEIAEIDRFDPQHLSFFNVNTEADLKAGRELARKEGFKSDKC
jgi:molybdopterin-guanine dinucleotide biosynthesis protein A